MLWSASLTDLTAAGQLDKENGSFQLVLMDLMLQLVEVLYLPEIEQIME